MGSYVQLATEEERLAIRHLSDKLVELQRPIRVLDHLKWDDSIQTAFFESKCKKLPLITPEYYAARPLPFDVEERNDAFYELESLVQRELGRLSGVGRIMQRMCTEYRMVCKMIQSRGTPRFGLLAERLYGGANDVFYMGGPTVRDLAALLADRLPQMVLQTQSELDEKVYSAQDVVDRLGPRLAEYFSEQGHTVRVEVSDSLVADAAAGADSIRIRSSARFSERDIRLLEVHEGWVHVGTTLNGSSQPVCTFLSKDPPSSTVTQEGLAVITELFTFSAFPARLRRLINRILAIDMLSSGANFLEVFQFFRAQGHDEGESYHLAARIFRGSLPDGSVGPFTKDLAYCRGFIMIYNFIRLAIQEGMLDYIPLLFIGKVTLEDIPVLAESVEQGLIELPRYVPPHFSDLAALSTWMSFSLFLNRVDLQKFALDFRSILRD